MQLIFDHILPVGGLFALMVLCVVGEALFRHFKPQNRVLPAVCVTAAVLAGTGMFLYLLSVGAGTELILPIVLLIMLISMIV